MLVSVSHALKFSSLRFTGGSSETVTETPLPEDSVASRLSRRLLGTPLAPPPLPSTRRSPRRLAAELAMSVAAEQSEAVTEQQVETTEQQV